MPTWDEIVDAIAALDPDTGDGIFWNGVTWTTQAPPVPHGHPYASDSHTHPYSPEPHTHSYADPAHTHNYAATAHTHAGMPTTIRKTANQANTTVTPADITDLAFAIASNERKYFRGRLFYTAAAATTGLAVGLTTPAGGPNILVAVQIATTASAFQNGVITSSGGEVLATASLGATTLWADIEGVVTAGNVAGNVALRFRSEIATSAVNILAGSYLTVWT